MFKSDCGVQGWIHKKDYFDFNLKKGPRIMSWR